MRVLNVAHLDLVGLGWFFMFFSTKRVIEIERHMIATSAKVTMVVFFRWNGIPTSPSGLGKKVICTREIVKKFTFSGWWQLKYFWNFHSYMGKMNPIWLIVFKMGWNHQAVFLRKQKQYLTDRSIHQQRCRPPCDGWHWFWVLGCPVRR